MSLELLKDYQGNETYSFLTLRKLINPEIIVSFASLNDLPRRFHLEQPRNAKNALEIFDRNFYSFPQRRCFINFCTRESPTQSKAK